MNYNSKIDLSGKEISINSPTYFIADIASNHDGDLKKAKQLIIAAKESGANAVKFQHFLADKIVSDYGFKNLGKKIGHQSKWGKSVYDVYKEYECNRQWSHELFEVAQKVGIDFLTTPYDIEAINLLDRYIPAYKIGSGDITWIEFIKCIAQKNKPVLLATGASSINDVERAVATILKENPNVILMQCNTNYSGDANNFKYINLNVLKSYSIRYPNMILGLSDHTPGHATVLGAIALGARVVEKHFTLNNNSIGPDHAFSMNPETWEKMIIHSRELENALGSGIKRVEENEKETVIVQRRCIRLRRDMLEGEIVTTEDIECLRPAPIDAYFPYQENTVIGKKLLNNKVKGDYLKVKDLLE